MFGASRYSVFADAIAHTIWELSPWGARNLQPPPEAAPEVDFELLDMADESEMIDVAQVSDWVETKINSFCKLAEVHAPDFALLHFSTYQMNRHNVESGVGSPKRFIGHPSVRAQVNILSNTSPVISSMPQKEAIATLVVSNRKGYC